MTTISSEKAKAIFHETKYRSKLERDFALHLESVRAEYGFKTIAHEAIRLKLGDGAWYKPDFLVVQRDGVMTLYEVKGHWREAAKVRIKVAASRHRYFEFVVVTREKGEWKYQRM